VRPLVTIGIPTYNRAASTLGESLRSALAQTYPEIEVLVSDNASSDDTPHFVEAFRNPRLRYFRHETGMGPNNNFNFLVEQTRGAYYLMLHDDDVLDPDMIATCMDAARDATGYGIIRSGTRLIDAEGRLLSEWPNGAAGLGTPEFFRAWFAGDTTLYLCSTIFNTAHLRAMGGFHSPRNLFQDVVAAFYLAAHHGRLDVREVKASFRVHTNILYSRARIRDWCDDSLYLLDTMCGLVPEDAALRAEGTRYLCHKMYTYTSRLPSLIERLLTYRKIARRFGHVYSPAAFLWGRHVRPRLAGAGRRLRRLLPARTQTRGILRER
jgi:glycosyltransferase involved in cell wall biosynthesis